MHQAHSHHQIHPCSRRQGIAKDLAGMPTPPPFIPCSPSSHSSPLTSHALRLGLLEMRGRSLTADAVLRGMNSSASFPPGDFRNIRRAAGSGQKAGAPAALGMLRRSAHALPIADGREARRRHGADMAPQLRHAASPPRPKQPILARS